MEILYMFMLALGTYSLGRLLAKFLLGFVFDWIEERNVHLAMAYLVFIFVLIISAIVYTGSLLF